MDVHFELHVKYVWYYLQPMNYLSFKCNEGHAVAWLVGTSCYKPEGRRFDSLCHRISKLTSFFQPHYGLGIDSAPNTNEYQESSWG
jgi:hypothetical protein